MPLFLATMPSSIAPLEGLKILQNHDNICFCCGHNAHSLIPQADMAHMYAVRTFLKVRCRRFLE